ncbi:zinc metallochaperone AztD [Streptomyces alkaliphilus]|uniref:zinc metallochaperone AztD n=1 Tax=Streptomyces alkaliphilus TaxID=1472722 RepID=UPI00118054D5|nr:zinc metallochaperone AztD [Streptomyces alkaliphilus]MQS09957.1 hypothetical protein [Streptomyces alkaliphilus]
MRTASRARGVAAVAATLTGALLLTACGGGDDSAASNGTGSDGNTSEVDETEGTTEAAEANEPLVLTHDGGLRILDGDTLEVVHEIELDGFNRINPVGDDRHVMVSTAEGFRVLDAVTGELTDVSFPGEKPGHVVHHAGVTVLFTDGTGEVTMFDTDSLGDGEPEVETHMSDDPHHGVAIKLSNGELVTTLGTEEARTGIVVLDADGEEIARNEDCPGVHGEATARDEAVVVGCQDGVLVYRDGAITKVESPDDYGRIGNQAGSEESAIVLGDYKSDPDAELERPERVSLIDTRTGELRLVDLESSYTFRSLARGPHGEALILGTDGSIHVIDPEAGEVVNSIPVVEAWEEPTEWQQPRPAIFVRDHTAYVTDPAGGAVHAVHVESGEILASAELPDAPNEISGVIVDAH